jgi:hypothetical protein
MVYRECTRHNLCSFRKFSKIGVAKSALPDLNKLFLALVLIISARSLPLIFSRLRAHFGKVVWAPTLETIVVVVGASSLLKIRPRAGLLLRLWWSIASLLLLLLRRSNNPSPWLRGLLRGCSWNILHNAMPRCRGTRGSSRCLVFLFSALCRDKIFLGDNQIH